MSDQPTLADIGRINSACLRAAFGFAGAWLFWRLAVPGFEAFLLFSAIWGFGGLLCAGKACIEIAKLLLRMRRWSRFKRQGVDPKADPIAHEQELRAKGLIK